MHIPDQLVDEWNKWQGITRTPFDCLNVGDSIDIYRIKGKKVFQGIISIQDTVTRISECYVFTYSGKYRKIYDRPYKIVKEKKEGEEQC